MKKIFYAFLILSIPLYYGCKEILVSYSDSGETVHLYVDQTLKLKLPGDASSSSDWRELTYDPVVLLKKGKSSYMLGDDNSPGYYYFRFRAMIPDTTTLRLEYGHKYDSDKKATKIFEIKVVVHAKGEKPS